MQLTEREERRGEESAGQCTVLQMMMAACLHGAVTVVVEVVLIEHTAEQQFERPPTPLPPALALEVPRGSSNEGKEKGKRQWVPTVCVPCCANAPFFKICENKKNVSS